MNLPAVSRADVPPETFGERDKKNNFFKPVYRWIADNFCYKMFPYIVTSSKEK